MPDLKNIFIEDSKIAFDLKHQKIINFNISKYNDAVKKGNLRYRNMDLAKQKASNLKENKAKLLVKSKSMISEEIELNENLENVGFEPAETDLGEFIVQVTGEKPYHILTPAMHKSKVDIAELLNKEFGTPPYTIPEDLTLYVRNVLRKKYTSAEIGVTGTKRRNETNGPEKMVVVLLDNKRSEITNEKENVLGREKEFSAFAQY